jgi:uncharacterized protein (TIGR03086 family)
MSTPAQQHREVAARFTSLVTQAPAGCWDDPSPVPEWRARDVVGHLVEWLRDFLAAGADVRLPDVPSAADDPVAAWQQHSAAVQALLDDPGTHERVLSNPHVGDVPLDQAVNNFYTGDVFLHTWDLARATGQVVELDAARCEEMLAGMEPIEDVMRESGQYGPRVPVPDEAPAQDRLVGFIGRDPAWRSARLGMRGA